MTTKRETKNRTSKPAAPVATSTAIVPSTSTAPATASAKPLTLTDVAKIADVTIPDGYVAPASIVAYRDAFRAVAAMPHVTPAERIAIRDAVIRFMDRALPGVPVPTSRTGRWTGAAIMDGQNMIFVAASMANVVIHNGHVMAVWAAEFPTATCGRKIAGCNGVPYIGRDYAWSALNDYVHGRDRSTSCVVPGAVVIVTAWARRDRKPVA